MHRDFRTLLDNANGISEFVFAINVDIRGFSDWSLTVDSAQTAIFVKKVYAKLIDRYFAQAEFVKPTGDGLFVIVGFDEGNLKQVGTQIVIDAIHIVENFGGLCHDEDMINFPVPREVGIGITRGTASRLASDGKTLDYSGRVLNLASRLMDLARPRGVVFDADFSLKLLPDELSKKFTSQQVYLKGIAPRTPMSIHYWPKDIEIPAFHLHPLGEKRWEQLAETITIAELEQLGNDDLSFDLEPPPGPNPELFCMIRHDAVTPGGRKSKKFRKSEKFPVALVKTGAKYEVEIESSSLRNYLVEQNIGRKWQVSIELNYRSL